MQAAMKKTSLEKHLERYAHCYESGVLVPAEHMRLVEDIHFYAEKAGIPPDEIYRHAREVLNDRERMFVKNVIRRGREGYGYALIGGEGTTKTARCRAMVAGCVRNFTNARFVPQRSLSERIGDGDPDIWKVTFVACPDFIPDTGILTEWEKSVMLSWMKARLAQRNYVAIGVPSEARFRDVFGDEAIREVKENFMSTKDPGKKG